MPCTFEGYIYTINLLKEQRSSSMLSAANFDFDVAQSSAIS